MLLKHKAAPGRLGTGALLLSVVMSGCAGRAAAAPAASSPEPVVVSGSGTSLSAPFELAGGDYQLTVAETPRDSIGCFAGGFLAAADGHHVAQLGSAQSDDASPASADGYAYSVAAGSYHLDMKAGCPWTVTVRQAP